MGELEPELKKIIPKIDKTKYDGIIIKNAEDVGPYGYPKVSDHYIPFSEKQIKLSQPLQSDLVQEARKEVDSTNWFRGQDKYNAKSGDSFYSGSEDVAGDFGKVSPIKNKAKNPLVISSKDPF